MHTISMVNDLRKFVERKVCLLVQEKKKDKNIIYQIYLEVQQLFLSIATTTEWYTYFSQNNNIYRNNNREALVTLHIHIYIILQHLKRKDE